MIVLENLTVKNFLSSGNVVQALNLTSSDLTLVTGENLDVGGDSANSKNGVGKSLIVNAISYALYGKALVNIKKSNLINKINGKGMVVTIAFSKGNNKYRIERGRSPTFLKFYVNDSEQKDDVDESQGDSRRTQEQIEELLEMSHDMFKHIVALNTYTEPFLSMRANDQRAIIEQLLGITILTEKATSLKEEIRSTKDDVKEETMRINAIKASNDNIQSTIDNLHSRQRAWKNKKRKDIEKLEFAIAELEKLDIEKELESHQALDEWKDYDRTKRELQKEQATLEAAIVRARKSVEKANNDISELDDAVCYACQQKLHEDKKAEILEKKTKELAESTTYFENIQSQLEKVSSKLEELGDSSVKPSTFYETAQEAYEHRSNVDNLKSALESSVAEEDPYQQQINDMESSAIQEISWDKVNELNGFLEHQEFLLKLLTNKDSFIRKKIIDQNLAYLNHRLTHYLDKLGLPHQVKFQNDLNVEITQLGQDLDFDNLSRGERNRLILGLSFSFRDVWESLYNGTNLLFVDELVDSGMDAAGVEGALAVLKQMTRERNKNIFLISHREELNGRVNNVLKVVKESGFTSFENEED